MQEKHGRGAGEALEMLDVFASVGVQFFDITHINLEGEKRGFRPKQSLATARTSMPFLVESAARRQNNVIVRPHHPRPVFLIQLDDVTEAAVTRLQPVAFLILNTSPGNHQAWIAAQGGPSEAEFARRVRKAAGADPTASGATRVAGTTNFKTKYAPAFPIVGMRATQPGRIVARAELEALGLVAAPEAVERPVRPAGVRAGKWPSYRYCLQRAPTAHGQDRPDISRADFTWCMTAIDWGWSVEDVAARLAEESEKARENGERYALETARNAAAAVQRRMGPSPVYE